MATETTNLKLSKPDTTDFYDIAVQNKNMDKIDEAITEKANKTDIPTSLPANGGNADTVGGKLPSSFSPAGHTHNKADVGLGNVDNTADANKSVNYASSAGSATNATNAANANYANGAGNADAVDGIHISVVTSLPSSRDANTLYLVKG